MPYTTKHDEQISSTDDFSDTYERINPDFHVNRILDQMTNCLGNPDLQAGHRQYCVLVQWLERHAEAIHKKLPEAYEESIKKYKESETYTSIAAGKHPAAAREQQEVSLAIFKAGKLLEIIYGKRPQRIGLKL